MAGTIINAGSEREFDDATGSSNLAIVYFWAPWCEPCRQLDKVLEVLAEKHRAVFVRVEAEEVTEVSIRHEVAVVPYFLFLKRGKVVDKLEGADVAALTAKVRQHCPEVSQGPERAKSSLAESHNSSNAATEKVKALINSQPVMLLMKGTPSAPRCGFSSRVVTVLQNIGVPFGHFDILTDEGVRQAAKVYSDWPSYPQLYVRGDLLGGCDIIEEMDATGELQQALQASASGNANGNASKTPEDALGERIQQLVKSSDVMLFMKGSPDAPRCGFSSKVVQALRSQDINFGSFDILQDQEVREGLKKHSDWPTYPQLYAGGELLGGCDIVLELLQQGKLKSDINAQLSSPA